MTLRLLHELAPSFPSPYEQTFFGAKLAGRSHQGDHRWPRSPSFPGANTTMRWVAAMDQRSSQVRVTSRKGIDVPRTYHEYVPGTVVSSALFSALYSWGSLATSSQVEWRLDSPTLWGASLAAKPVDGRCGHRGCGPWGRRFWPYGVRARGRTWRQRDEAGGVRPLAHGCAHP